MEHPQRNRNPKAQLILWIVLSILALLTVSVLGIGVASDAHAWSLWLKSQATPLLLWRTTLYGATAYGWYRMRRRLIANGLSAHQHQRLLYAEFAAVVAIATLELSTLRQN